MSAQRQPIVIHRPPPPAHAPAEEPAAPQAPPAPTEAPHVRRLKIMLPLLLVLVFLVYAFTTNFIPSDSMLPTLRPGDHILTMRSWLAYPMGRMPARGDIIVFRGPDLPEEGYPPGADEEQPTGPRKFGVFRNESGEILIKRVVGLPGETVQVVGTEVFINGFRMERHYKVIPPTPDLGDYPFAVQEPLKLGPDELFVLGDNLANSDDGRFWGPLKRSQVIGKFVGVLFHESNGPNMRRAGKS